MPESPVATPHVGGTGSLPKARSDTEAALAMQRAKGKLFQNFHPKRAA
jgi:hypothetical protein